MNNCLICKSCNTERHHIWTRGAGGVEDEWNIMHLCRSHHVEFHKIGRTSFIRKYRLEANMEARGWEYIKALGKWFPPKLY